MSEGTNIPSTPLDVLKKYWGHQQFRSLQEDIIQNTLNGRHGLALMPTGGGKSICFQVPGMMLEGMCIVVSPLIALMKDQVEQLQKKGIEARAIVSGMHKHEIDIALDNCIYGHVKFLYISPERLKSDLFIARLEKMHVSLLVIDEAHCISQWGYDFRPAYLEIKEIRKHLPDKTPLLALTATATPQIREDILEKLEIQDAGVFSKSFLRKNLSYKAVNTQNKNSQMIDLLKSKGGSSIVYVRSRKMTRFYSDLIEKAGIKSSFYHAGLSSQVRDKIQADWVQNKTRTMVATNAFGMGIDKADVRLVIHMDLPDSLEAYYQEAGRAGRDEKYAEAIIIYQDKDILDLRAKTEKRFPDLQDLRKAYTAICNYYQIALGSGELQSFPCDLADISAKFNIKVLEMFYAIKELEKHGYIQFEENASSYSSLNILIDNQNLYRFQVANPKYDSFIKSLVRIYGAELFRSYVKISEDYIASKTILNHNQVILMLEQLVEQQIIDYIPRSDKPRITFLIPRQDTHQSFIRQRELDEDRKKYFDRMNAMISYVEIQNMCRTNYLQDYFGEKNLRECGICDNCLKKKKSKEVKTEDRILIYLEKFKKVSIEEINSHLSDLKPEEINQIIRELALQKRLIINEKREIMLP